MSKFCVVLSEQVAFLFEIQGPIRYEWMPRFGLVSFVQKTDSVRSSALEYKI